MLGTTLVRPILAVLRIPHRTGSMQSSLAYSRDFAAPDEPCDPPNRSADNQGNVNEFLRRLGGLAR
jgi:hypothetical protein